MEERHIPTKEEWNQYKDLEYYPDRVCECGCEGKIKVQLHHKYSGIPKYIWGHNPGPKKFPPQTVEQKRKRSESLMNHVVAQETREKIRKANIGKHNSKGENNPFYGKHHSKESNQKRAETRRNNGRPWHSKETIEKMKNSHKDKENPAKRPEVRKKISKNRKGKCSGENHWNWQNGVSKFPYPFDFNEELKELIRKRDKVCQLCGKTQEQEREEVGKKLPVHHIDYDRENLNPNNLITLCCSCNSKVNFGRKNWIKFFQLKLKMYLVG